MKNSDKTGRLIRLDKSHVWHPFTQMKEWLSSSPVIIERGEGNYLIDTDGRRYLDGVSSLWVNLHGHRKKEIDRAIKAQIERIAHTTLLGLGNVPSIELADRLIRIAPGGLKKVFYSDNGSTAVEIALKMAFQYWAESGHGGKRRFVSFTGAYHGDTFGSMSVGEIDVFVKKYRPLLFKTIRSPYPYCYRCPVEKAKGAGHGARRKKEMNYPDCGLECLNVLERILRKHSGETAALIIEPLIQGASGMITSPPGFLKGARGLAKRYKVLFIADEVATGFGRTGTMFACDRERVRPDILCLAKGLTGGYLPLAATLVTDDIYRAFLGGYEEQKTFFHGHTYTGNPLGCAAALANIEVFEKEKVIKGLKKKIALFEELLEGFRALRHVGDVRNAGLMAGIELVKDRVAKEPYPPEERVGFRVLREARRLGLIIRPLGDTVVLMPPLSITEDEMRRMAEITFECVRTVTG